MALLRLAINGRSIESERAHWCVNVFLRSKPRKAELCSREIWLPHHDPLHFSLIMLLRWEVIIEENVDKLVDVLYCIVIELLNEFALLLFISKLPLCA